jgi:hypothetical protein
MQDKDKPVTPTVTAQEAVEAYNVLREVCGKHEAYPALGNSCPGCPFKPTHVCVKCFKNPPSDWPDLKESPHA